MHYVFFSTGSWEGNASMVRPRALGGDFVRRGIRVTYLVDDVDYNRSRLGVDPGAAVVYNPTTGGAGQFASRRRLLARLRPDFVHVLNPAPKTAAGLWGTPWRVVGDWDEWPAMRPHGPLRAAMERTLDRWLRNRAAPAVVASRYLQAEFKRRYNRDAAYVPYATYLTNQPPVANPFPARTAVYMGNFFSAYDHDLLFDAARHLKARGRPCPITFLGDGPDIEQWRAFARDHQLTDLDVRGYTTGPDLWARLRHAHVLLFPFRPTVLNLARCPSKTFAYAQARRPIITNRTGEVFELLGDRGTYVAPTPEAFADAIDRALSRDLPDVDYGVERHTWTARADALLAALG